MRLRIITVLLVFLLSCTSDGGKGKNKVIPPSRLKTIVEANRTGKAKGEPAKGGKQSRSHISPQKHKNHRSKPVKVINITHTRQPDSIRLSNIEMLRISGIEPDLSEPLNRDLLLHQSGDTIFGSAISLSRDRVLKIGFDNDIFDYTDQFYTNGIRFDFVAPAISDNPVKHILLPYWSKAKNYYGISLVQNLYTPSTTKAGGILYGDRPYSAYLSIGSFKITNDETHHFRQTSELDLGVIGPPSMGGLVQDLFHKYVPNNNEPLGWENQIATDVVIDYSFALEKGIINSEYVQLIFTGTGVLGTLYTNFGGGFSLRLGWFNDYFSDLGIRKRRILKASGARVAQYFFTLKGMARVIAYDATLEGGMINTNSEYTIPASAIANIITQSSLGFTVTYGGLGIELEQNLLSPEFSYRWWHAWGHIGLFFAL
ncbi:MAG: lipid A deacylase LpxR family protein [Bacteroidetes bacterium]|nr:lipid A deacylase LpxR family protein [Bacteroidota bacterium]